MSIDQCILESFFVGADVHSQYAEIAKDLHLTAPKVEKPLYRRLRSTFFSQRQIYVSDFVTKNINSYEDLLQFGQYELKRIYAKKDKNYHSATAVEPSLFEQDWPILQMIELNKYFYTTASTNYPTTLFQEMFVVFEVTPEGYQFLKDKLKDEDLEIEFLNEDLEPFGLWEQPWAKNLIKLEISDPVLERRNLYQRLIDLFSS